MKTNVFISWSGDESLKHAEVIKDLIRGCFSHAKVFISTEMDRGSIWLTKITSELDGAKVGIVCLTKENKDTSQAPQNTLLQPRNALSIYQESHNSH